MNSEICDTNHSEEFQHCSGIRKSHVLLMILLSFLIGCCHGNVFFGMTRAFAILRKTEYLQGFLWILHGNLFNELFENLGIPSIATISLLTIARILKIALWMILRIIETVQNGNFWKFKFNDISPIRDFLMQYNVSGFLCPVYACLKALEPIFVFCSQFILFLHCWKIATQIFLPFSFHDDHCYILCYAKFLSTGTAVQSGSCVNTFIVYIS